MKTATLLNSSKNGSQFNQKRVDSHKSYFATTVYVQIFIFLIRLVVFRYLML